MFTYFRCVHTQLQRDEVSGNTTKPEVIKSTELSIPRETVEPAIWLNAVPFVHPYWQAEVLQPNTHTHARARSAWIIPNNHTQKQVKKDLHCDIFFVLFFFFEV